MYSETPNYPKGIIVKTQEFTPAIVTGIAASFCSGVVVRTALRGILVSCAPINPIVSFVGITALSMTVEDRVAKYVAKSTQDVIDTVQESWKTSEDSK
nr:MAG TPA: hypothetical protein [Caudoviricetes sp.]